VDPNMIELINIAVKMGIILLFVLEDTRAYMNVIINKRTHVSSKTTIFKASIGCQNWFSHFKWSVERVSDKFEIAIGRAKIQPIRNDLIILENECLLICIVVIWNLSFSIDAETKKDGIKKKTIIKEGIYLYNAMLHRKPNINPLIINDFVTIIRYFMSIQIDIKNVSPGILTHNPSA